MLRVHILRFWKRLLVGLALGIVSIILALVQPFWAGELISRVQTNSPVSGVLLVVVLLSLAGAIAIGLQQLILGILAEQSTATWRQWLLSEFFRLPMLGRRSEAQGWYTSRLVTDPPVVGRFVGTVLVQGIQSGLMMIGSLILLLRIDAVTVLFPVFFASMAIGVALVAARPAGRGRLAVQQQNELMADRIGVSVSAARVIISSNADSIQQEKIESAVETARIHGSRLAVIYSLLGPATVTLMQVAYASVFVVGAWRVSLGVIDFPELITFFLIFGSFQSAVQDIAAFPGGISESRAAVQRLADIDSLQSWHTGSQGGLKATRVSSEDAQNIVEVEPAIVTFKNVGYSYPGTDKQLLDGASFAIPENSLSVLVGPSGGGKSTVLGLIEGFFLPDSGEIHLFGENLTVETAAHLRESMGYVDQDATIVGRTVRESLEFASTRRMSDDEMLRAFASVGLSQWLEARGGLDTDIGPEGVALSGGQKQRVAIARALLRSPNLLILDEPTSSLDGLAEAQVRQVLRKLATNCTVLLSAHRLSTILEADWIIVVDDGTVVGEGSHESLLQECEYYRCLVDAQTSSVSLSQ